MDKFITAETDRAVSRFRLDIERFDLARPAILYALLDETHRSIMTAWHQQGTFVRHRPKLMSNLRIRLLVLHNGYCTNWAINFTYTSAACAQTRETLADALFEELQRLDYDVHTRGTNLH